jgi:hypothetical protein
VEVVDLRLFLRPGCVICTRPFTEVITIAGTVLQGFIITLLFSIVRPLAKLYRREGNYNPSIEHHLKQ